MGKNSSELERENESLTGFWANAWNTVTFRMGKSADEIEKNGERMTEAMKFLNDLILQSKVAAAAAKAEFAKAMGEATADGEIGEDEEKRLRKAQDAYSLAEGLVDKYEAKLRNAREATERQTAVVRPQGTFYANAAQSLRDSQMEQRMLTATQEIAKHTKKTTELLKDGSGGGSSLTFQ